MAEPPTKRRRLSNVDGDAPAPATLSSLSHPISPPRKKRDTVRTRITSPFRLTSIRDLVDTCNVGAVSLGDLVGDPLIAELWDFNYLHDLDFLMGHLDEDTRALTRVHVVHGFWKREDPNRLLLQEQVGRHKNITLHTAYMPEIPGHNPYSKHDYEGLDEYDEWDLDFAIAPKTQIAWAGSCYLRAYNKVRNVCGSLVEELTKYDFSAVRAALIASVPGKHDVDQEPEVTRWGWQGLKETLKSVPVQPGASDIAVQISSIATLGATDTWLQRTLFDSLAASKPSFQQLPSSASSRNPRPNFKIIFPTADEIRRSLDGYASGGSIHTKIQSAAQTKQLQYLRPLFHHWANNTAEGVVASTPASGNAISCHRDAGRKRAAPHIKTYIRYGDKSIDWALLTSANISKQAWGEAINKAGEVRIASWELGVLVWPELLTGDAEAKMVGTFKADEPKSDDDSGDDSSPIVGLRIPYNLPLQKYGDSEVPWVATMSYTEPDWLGRVWLGY
ncbi:hypothetical protein GQX73_g9137 [Xylaria multiplex]|uniref:PLD phosphodiesterase domain-containing protein n=1 Tax=Xylaria multiplex TaxID=323545 RepID=A0A7C8IR54_9PEZI|nr:hypothetical protein GQX73_g9137 [Xylaria multiplex]